MNIDVEVLEWTTRLGKCPCYPMRPSVTLLCAYIGAQVISSSQVAKLTGPRLSGTLMSEGNHNVSTYAQLRPRPFLALPCDTCFSRSNCVPYYWSQPIANSRPIRAQGKSPNNFYIHDGAAPLASSQNISESVAWSSPWAWSPLQRSAANRRGEERPQSLLPDGDCMGVPCKRTRGERVDSHESQEYIHAFSFCGSLDAQRPRLTRSARTGFWPVALA